MSLIRFFNTVRYLKPIQVYGRYFYKPYKPLIKYYSLLKQRMDSDRWVIPAKREIKMVGEVSFKFLNETEVVSGAQGWNISNCSKLWLYNLHYFDDLNAKDASERVDWHQKLIGRWIDGNPQGSGNAWEPYPTSLRIVNWIKWTLSGNQLKKEWLNSLSIQIGHLFNRLEIHLLGNHLFANAKALVYAGLFFEGKEANKWLQTGQKIIEREVPEQILADGGHFELSTMYHALAVEDLLDLVNIYRNYSIEVPACILNVVTKSLGWLTAMLHPDGEIAFFNDAAMGVAPSYIELANYAKQLSFDIPKIQDGTCHLSESGYVRVQEKDMVAILDVARIGPDYLPAHAHADTLTFELSLFGQRVVVNSGTSIYEVGDERHRQRGTSAHNTVEIDGENSSEVWSGFRVARRARPKNVRVYNEDNVTIVEGCHDGYQRLPGKPVHCRRWIFKDRMLKILDKVEGKGIHNIVSYFHLHPDINVLLRKNEVLLILNENRKIRMNIARAKKIEINHSTYHPEFGKKIPSNVIKCQYYDALPSGAEIEFHW